MANKYRGEVEITIAGKAYTVAFTLDALAQIVAALGTEKMSEASEVIAKQRPSDMPLIILGLLKGNGHDVAIEDVKRLNPSVYFDDVLPLLFPPKADKAGDDKASPRKRA